MSASFLVDLHNATIGKLSIFPPPYLSGGCYFPGSGAIVGVGVNFNVANAACNLEFAGTIQSGTNNSGLMRIAVQCSDVDVSGLYTDPTSGLAQIPPPFASGGILWINSGLDGGPLEPFKGGSVYSGFIGAALFQRTGTFARAIIISGDMSIFVGTIGFRSQYRTTGSGGGNFMGPQGSFAASGPNLAVQV